MTMFGIVTLACSGLLNSQDFSQAQPEPYKPASLTAAQPSEEKIALHVYGMVGYGFPIGGVFIPYVPEDIVANPEIERIRHTQSQTINQSGDIIEVRDKYLNYGQGLKCQLGAEIDFMKNLAGDISFLYTGGLPYLKVEFNYPPMPNGGWTETYKKHCFGLVIAVKPKFMLLDLLEMYSGVGIGLYFTRLTFTNSDPSWGQNEGYIKTRPAIGFTGQLGSYYPLSDRFDIKAEIAFEALSFNMKEYHTTYDNMTYYFVRNSTADNERPRVKIPGSNWAIKLGIRFKVL
jgi:opacity protein-like surface antigen